MNVSGDEPIDSTAYGRPTWAGLRSWDVSGALMRYRVMAYIVGVGLVLVVFVGIPLQYAAHKTLFVHVVGTLHGYLYLLYLASAADLGRRARWSLGRILAVVAAGFVPFLAFVVEHRVLRQMREEHAEASAGDAPLSSGAVPADPSS
jgi:integral membrane protein